MIWKPHRRVAPLCKRIGDYGGRCADYDNHRSTVPKVGDSHDDCVR